MQLALEYNLMAQAHYLWKRWNITDIAAGSSWIEMRRSDAERCCSRISFTGRHNLTIYSKLEVRGPRLLGFGPSGMPDLVLRAFGTQAVRPSQR